MRSLNNKRLHVEFICLFIIAPILLKLLLPFANLYLMIGVISIIGVVILNSTDGFHWRQLLELAPIRRHWRAIALWTVFIALIVFPLSWWLAPERFLALPRERPLLLLIIWTFYPWVSVLGQEVIYRVLFFERYGLLFSTPGAAVLVNAACFSAMHLIFENWVAPCLTFFAGLIFARLYQQTRSFGVVFVLHWIAGGLVFTAGIGWYFYYGAVRAGA